MNISIRNIHSSDNASLAVIIRKALEEFGANHPGTVYYDASTDALFELFQHPGAFYLVAEDEGIFLGGAGIFPTEGLPAGTCELVKMYLSPTARGKGIGKLLIDDCLAKAAAIGYTQVYLETMPELKKAVTVYEKFGFEYLEGPLGNTGHFGCDIWMLKKL
ncbi:GNAT family N-acetyltransferase [Ferruginibacter sp. HRS2-29]|uniref:GNAT family N-acetyltransferase n=1 Tax=Ferruginibacter sp. HRS2-29 TaxID=2487334 RepID=UPI0020CD4294|nr:GNAT family N-acetyltransferase [Ferruginibacter sp. HRS2-29]MCP9750098.1 GNAT family N-acetyltransferase [Ferruginibacter sp. HRS2-29]